jgi:hypothetical protein
VAGVVVWATVERVDGVSYHARLVATNPVGLPPLIERAL